MSLHEQFDEDMQQAKLEGEMANSDFEIQAKYENRMNNLKPYLEYIQTKFPVIVSIEESNYFNKSGFLFKNEKNDFVFFSFPDNSLTRQFFIEFFKSNFTDFDKIEGDYLEFSIRFFLTDIENLNVLIDAYF
jgi:hypothetical protein